MRRALAYFAAFTGIGTESDHGTFGMVTALIVQQ